MEVRLKSHASSMAVNGEAKPGVADSRAGPYREGEGEAVGKCAEGSHPKVEGEGVSGTAVGECGAKDGVPEEGRAVVIGGSVEYGEGLSEETKAAIDGDEAGG